MPWSAAALVPRLLLDGALRRRVGLEAGIGNRLATLHREPVRAVGQPLLGPLHRRELLAQAVGQAFVAFVLVQVGTGVPEVLVDVRELVVGLAREFGQRLLDPIALGLEQLARPFGLHY